MKNEPREIEVEVVQDGPSSSASSTSTGPSRPGKQIDDPLIAFVARLMDSVFTVPGTNIRFGLDPILGLVPGLGDTVTSVVSTLLLLKSAQYGVPRVVLARMAMNVIANTAVGSIPVVGDAFSVWFKSNAKNYELLQKHAGTQRKATTGDWIFIIAVIAVVIGILALLIVGAATLLSILGDWLRGTR